MFSNVQILQIRVVTIFPYETEDVRMRTVKKKTSRIYGKKISRFYFLWSHLFSCKQTHAV